jgi:hypothetical protein
LNRTGSGPFSGKTINVFMTSRTSTILTVCYGVVAVLAVNIGSSNKTVGYVDPNRRDGFHFRKVDLDHGQVNDQYL